MVTIYLLEGEDMKPSEKFNSPLSNREEQILIS